MIYFSLLRGINVSGQKKIQMAKLKLLYDSLGFQNVTTYIQSGNVIFESNDKDCDILSERISQKILDTFGFEVTVIIRTKDEWIKVIKNNPFAGKAEIDQTRLYITFLHQEPDEIDADGLDQSKSKTEKYAIVGKEFYFYCPDGYGRTKLSNTVVEKKLKVTATTRNWNTVNKLLEMTDNK